MYLLLLFRQLFLQNEVLFPQVPQVLERKTVVRAVDFFAEGVQQFLVHQQVFEVSCSRQRLTPQVFSLQVPCLLQRVQHRVQSTVSDFYHMLARPDRLEGAFRHRFYFCFYSFLYLSFFHIWKLFLEPFNLIKGYILQNLGIRLVVAPSFSFLGHHFLGFISVRF